MASADFNLNPERMIIQQDSSTSNQSVKVAITGYNTSTLNSNWINSDLIYLKILSADVGLEGSLIFFSGNIDGLARLQIDDQKMEILRLLPLSIFVGVDLSSVDMYKNGRVLMLPMLRKEYLNISLRERCWGNVRTNTVRSVTYRVDFCVADKLIVSHTVFC